MKLMDAVNQLDRWDSRGQFYFTTGDLAALFGEGGGSLVGTLRRLRQANVLASPVRGVHIYRPQRRGATLNLEAVARTARRGDLVYESLESALSQWGAISQIPLGRITLMTTGREAEFSTPWGVAELTHTSREPAAITGELLSRPGHLIPIASPELAYENLRHVGRNLGMVDLEELACIIAERAGLEEGDRR